MTDTAMPAKSQTYGALVWQMFRRNRLAVASLGLITMLLLAGTFAPFLANDRPLLVIRPDGSWNSPVVDNLNAGDFIVLVIFSWVLVQLLFRLLTVDAENPTRRVIRLPGIARAITLWTVTAAAAVLIVLISSGEKRIYDEVTDWQEVVRTASPDTTFWLPPVGYRPEKLNSSQALQRPTWQVRSRENYVERERARLKPYVDKGFLDKDDFEDTIRAKATEGLDVPERLPYYHWLGTDHLGGDAASQLIHGARISLVVGFVSVSIAIVIGTFVGALGGYFGGKVDFWVMRFVEVVMCFPTIFLILAMSVIVTEKSVFSVMFIIGITGWTGSARLVRGEFFKQRAMEYVTAAQAIGATPLRIMFRHVLPNAMAPLLVGATFGIASAIIIEATLSFLNLGVPDDVASWGRTLSYGIEYAKYAWWLILFPGLAIFLAVTSYNLAGEGLRDAIDPRMRN